MASGSSSIVSLKLRRSLPVHARFPGCFHHDHGDQWKRGMINDRGFKFHRGFGVFAQREAGSKRGLEKNDGPTGSLAAQAFVGTREPGTRDRNELPGKHIHTIHALQLAT